MPFITMTRHMMDLVYTRPKFQFWIIVETVAVHESSLPSGLSPHTMLRIDDTMQTKLSLRSLVVSVDSLQMLESIMIPVVLCFTV